MRVLFIFLCVWFSISDCPGQASGPRVAITIDDGPVTRFHIQPSAEIRLGIVEGLLEALATYRAPATLFVVTEDLEDNPEAGQLLQMWMRAGIEVGNHTHSHLSLNDLGNARYHEDIQRAQIILNELVGDEEGGVRYFRAPYLQDGATIGARDSLLVFLDDLQLLPAPVTIALEDWRYNDSYEDAIQRGVRDEQDRIAQAYLDHAGEMIDRFDLLAVQLERRRIPHVLLLHANTINRDYLRDILNLFATRGFSFVTLDEVYRDPVYRQIPPPDREGASLLIRLARESGWYAE